MTTKEAITKLKKIELIYTAHGLLFSELMTYKPENIQLLRDCAKEYPELKIYENEKKYRIVVKLS